MDNKKKLTGVSDKSGNLKILVSREGKYKVRLYIPRGARFNVSLYEGQQEIFKGGGPDIKTPYLDYEVEVKNNQCGWFDSEIIE